MRLRFAADTLEIDVRDDGPSSAARPLMGIRERVHLHGGRLSAGPHRSGGHSVRATLPLDGHAVPREEPEEPACAAFTARPTSLLRRLRQPAVADSLAAVALAIAGLVEVIAAPEREGPLAANLALALAYSLPIAWRRRAPLPALVTALAASLAMGLAFTSVDALFVPFVVVLALTYACGAYREGLTTYAGLALAVVALPAIVATMEDRVAADYVFPTLIASVTWLAGRAMRTRARLTEELHETAARLAEAHEDEGRLAAIDERRRIAREMHDLVAHSMSVMVVQAGGARRILDRDPSRALEAATRIERTGREALDEMRHLLGVLHVGDVRPELAPQPTLAEIGELVGRARAAGLPAVLELYGDRRALSAGQDLAAYRIVQEALTNAIKHAGGAPTTVCVQWSEHALAIEIRDHGTGAARNGDSGHGLVGMRERVRLYGGDLEAGPASGGGWRVHATFPLHVRELSAA